MVNDSVGGDNEPVILKKNREFYVIVVNNPQLGVAVELAARLSQCSASGGPLRAPGL